MLSSLDDLFNWYNGFVKDLAIEEDVKILASEIVNESDSESEKVRKIFYWVQENVKYIAFEQGMRGFIPHPAAYVMNKRYGDCKDMSSLLVGLLRSVGIDANYTWIGSRDLPYSYLEIPSPIVDNHMIASVEIDGSRVFLDATGNYTPLGFPTSMIQGKECLVNKGDSYEIVSVPVIEKERNQMIDTSEVWIEDGNLFGRGRTYLTGLAKVANTYKMIQKTQKKEDDYIRRLLSRGSNKFFLDFHEVFNLDDLDKEIEVVHEFRVEDYYKEVNDRVYVNLCLDKSLLNDLIKDREVPKENDYKYINRSVTHFQIPEGYVVSDVPQNSSGDFEVFGYSITYVSEAERLTVTKDFFVDYLLLEVDQFDQWNKGIKEYSKAIRNAVALNKTTKQ
ncbi:MAG: transglutaminase domain-containing protein [Cyclobacteriaceae bacterium]